MTSIANETICGFEIDFPKLTITKKTTNPEQLLKNAGVEYKMVTDRYITFAGRVFGCDIPLMVGFHFDEDGFNCIEIYRPREYYSSGSYDANASYAEISQVLRNKYGEPHSETSDPESSLAREWWITPAYGIDHYVMERFGPEERLYIIFPNE